MKKKNANANYEAWRKERGSWGAISPITKVVPNKKKKNTKTKHRKKDYDAVERDVNAAKNILHEGLRIKTAGHVGLAYDNLSH